MHRAFPITAIALIAAACSEPATLSVTDAWVRLPAAPGRPGVAYFTLRGGAEDARLLSVTSPVVIRTEMHETMRIDTRMQGSAGGGMAGQGAGHGSGHGAMAMRPIATPVRVPAAGTVSFAEGGRHVMLFNINPGITPARRVPLVFTFADGRRLTFNAPVVAAGSPAPGAG